MSSRNTVLALFALGTLCTLGACDKKEPAATEATAPSTAPAPPAAPARVAAATPAPVDIDSLPVEEEFEGDAEKELTVANLNAKLDGLEKEISAP